MVHLLLVASLMLFIGWFAGLIGVLNVHTGWILLVVSWWLGIAWCYGWYYKTHYDHGHYHHPT
jgi:hypothetical protein